MKSKAIKYKNDEYQNIQSDQSDSNYGLDWTINRITQTGLHQLLIDKLDCLTPWTFETSAFKKDNDSWQEAIF